MLRVEAGRASLDLLPSNERKLWRFVDGFVHGHVITVFPPPTYAIDASLAGTCTAEELAE